MLPIATTTAAPTSTTAASTTTTTTTTLGGMSQDSSSSSSSTTTTAASTTTTVPLGGPSGPGGDEVDALFQEDFDPKTGDIQGAVESHAREKGVNESSNVREGVGCGQGPKYGQIQPQPVHGGRKQEQPKQD